MAELESVLDSDSLLGEGALWDITNQVLWWLDIKGRLIHLYDPSDGSDRTWPTPLDVGSLACREKGGLVVAMGRPG